MGWVSSPSTSTRCASTRPRYGVPTPTPGRSTTSTCGSPTSSRSTPRAPAIMRPSTTDVPPPSQEEPSMTTDQVIPVPPDADADAATPDPVVVARVKALESLLLEKGILASETVDRIADLYEKEVGPRNGARAVARAWTAPGFKQRLLADPVAACAELGIGGMQGEDMVVVENTDDVHNV